MKWFLFFYFSISAFAGDLCFKRIDSFLRPSVFESQEYIYKGKLKKALEAYLRVLPTTIEEASRDPNINLRHYANNFYVPGAPKSDVPNSFYVYNGLISTYHFKWKGNAKTILEKMPKRSAHYRKIPSSSKLALNLERELIKLFKRILTELPKDAFPLEQGSTYSIHFSLMRYLAPRDLQGNRLFMHQDHVNWQLSIELNDLRGRKGGTMAFDDIYDPSLSMVQQIRPGHLNLFDGLYTNHGVPEIFSDELVASQEGQELLIRDVLGIFVKEYAP